MLATQPPHQTHLLRWWPVLAADQRQSLARQLEKISFADLQCLFENVSAGRVLSISE
jgi:hypothetical protein